MLRFSPQSWFWISAGCFAIGLIAFCSDDVATVQDPDDSLTGTLKIQTIRERRDLPETVTTESPLPLQEQTLTAEPERNLLPSDLKLPPVESAARPGLLAARSTNRSARTADAATLLEVPTLPRRDLLPTSFENTEDPVPKALWFTGTIEYPDPN